MLIWPICDDIALLHCGNHSWQTLFDAVNGTATTKPSFLGFSGACYYFGESLTDILGAAAPPIGLINTAVGGSYIRYVGA